MADYSRLDIYNIRLDIEIRITETIWKHTNSESPPHPEGEVTVMPEAKEDQNNIVNACVIVYSNVN